jgi:hypothetical protein
MTPEALQQFLLIHGKLASMQLQPDVSDEVIWRWTVDGQYSATSAYAMQFEGALCRHFRVLIWSGVMLL